MEFEQKIKRLEEVVQSMQKGDLSLDESLRLFEEGVKLSKECHLSLEQAQQKVQILMGVDEAGQAQLADFTGTENDGHQ